MLAYFFQKRSVDIVGDHIHVRSSFYSHSIPLNRITAIEEVDSDILGIRTNGAGLPGFKSGWFQARPSGARYLLMQPVRVAWSQFGWIML